MTDRAALHRLDTVPEARATALAAAARAAQPFQRKHAATGWRRPVLLGLAGPAGAGPVLLGLARS